MIDATHLTKLYRKGSETVRALDDVSLRIRAGEFVAVQGPSGCGKTTLLLAIGGLLGPDEGRVFVNGADVYADSADRRACLRAESIGFVFQQFHLVPYLNVLENVLVPALATGRSNDRKSRAMELIDRFNLASRIHHVPAELSTGERQRTALARAMLNGPKLLLADEPTGNLDSENAQVVLGVLKDFAQSGGAVLLVTHDRSAAASSHRIVRMRDGKILQGDDDDARRS